MNEKLIELGLRPKPDSSQNDTKPASTLASVNSRILGVLSETAVESSSLNTSQFRIKLENYRRRIENGPDGDPQVLAAANECLRLIQDYLQRARTHLFERETEFAEVIEVMRLALRKLSGDATSFNTKLIGSSERLNLLVNIEDIRELKRRIRQEVADLSIIVEEKQKQDEVQYAKLVERIDVLQRNLVRSEKLAATDPLTRVASRSFFDQELSHWVATHQQNQSPFVLAIFDVDDFKQINDSHGHQVGDRVLFCLAQWLAECAKSSDVLARYAGDEFALVTRELQRTQAEAKFTELLAGIASCSYAFDRGGEERTIGFTVSCGVAEFNGEESGEDLLRRADEALYLAKRTGKNRVVLAKTERSVWKSLPWLGLSKTNKSKS